MQNCHSYGIDIDADHDCYSPSTSLLLQSLIGHPDLPSLRSRVALRLQQLEREARSLKRLHNETISVCRLPPEILSTIFLRVVALHDNREGRHMYNWDKVKEDISWIRIAHVCRRWRDIALGCPSLWTVIPLTRPAAVTAFLTHSRGHPIMVEYRGIDPRSRDTLYLVLKTETHRLRALRLTRLHEHDSEELSRCTGPAPALEELRINCSSTGDNVLSPAFLRGGAPSLTHLELMSCSFTWETLPLNAGLIHLILSPPLLPSTLTAVRPLWSLFTSAFQPMLSLQTLHLTDMLPDRSPAGIRKELHLPALTDLQLRDSTDRIQRFLQSAYTPRASMIRLNFSDIDPHSFSCVLNCLVASCEDVTTHSRLDDKIRACKVGGGVLHGPQFDFTVDGRGGRPPLRLNLLIAPIAEDFTLADAYHLLARRFDFTPVHTLGTEPFTHIERNAWRTIYGQLQKLSTVVLAPALDQLLSLLDALKEGGSGTTGSEPEGPLFPSLKTIICQDVYFDRGLTGLKELSRRLAVALSGRPDHLPLELRIHNATNFNGGSIDYILEAVPKLKLMWDGRLQYDESDTDSGDSGSGDEEF